MDVIEEALRKGKRGVVLMKNGQGGGSEAIINAWAWLQTYYPGPSLYLISKDELAREFGRERFSYIIDTCDPIRRKAIRGRTKGELVHIKRFTDGKLVIQGGRSVLNLQTTPYRFVIIDEVDSLLDEIQGQGDPLKLAEVRMDAFPGNTLMIAFAHPSIKERGAGKLYYDLSDQRRAFAPCFHCGTEFWPQWGHVKVHSKEGESLEAARRNPARYCYVTPCCGCILTDAQRFTMCRETEQKSVLDPEVAAEKPWIGVHMSQLLMPNKTLRFLAEKYVEGIEDDATMRVFVNKRMGDCFQAKVAETTLEDWRRLSTAPHGGVYYSGEVPSWVSFLTAGQDSGARELHYSIWGWGQVRDISGHVNLCGAMIESGVRDKDYSETLDPADLRPFDQLIYDRQFGYIDESGFLQVQQCYHDAGWSPVGVYHYCRSQPLRAVPIKGGASDDRSPQPPFRWGGKVSYVYAGQQFSDNTIRQGILNTFRLKSSFLGMVRKRLPVSDLESIYRLSLPADVSEEFLRQVSSEFMTVDRGKRVWKNKGPNHWLDSSLYAYAAALNMAPLHGERTRRDITEGVGVRRPYLEKEQPNPEVGGSYRERRQRGWRIGR